MKKFSIIFLYLIFFQSLNAEINLDEKLSLNKEIVYGKLDNNLTYYIKKNSNPKKKASISLIVKAGSLMEDDDQLGIAHLIEHMTFNGTKNYPKNEIDKYLSSIGLQIGSDYNASTGFETTSYSMEIPTDDISKIEKGIHILSEMVGFASLEDSSFEKERKIVLAKSLLNWRPRSIVEKLVDFKSTLRLPHDFELLVLMSQNGSDLILNRLK